MFKDIKASANWVSVEPVNKGWSEKFGQDDIDGMVRRARAAFTNYDSFKNVVPKWYTDEYRAKYTV